jgi:hypothetical protein
VQAGVQEWKRRITVTTAPGEVDTTITANTSNNTETETKDSPDGCCSSDAGGCCTSSQRPPCTSHQTTITTTTTTTTSPSTSTPFSSLLCYGCLTNLRDLDLKFMASQEDSSDELMSSTSFELPPYVAETIVHRMGFASLDEFEHRSVAAAPATAVDPQESLRTQIQEFLIPSDDEDE